MRVLARVGVGIVGVLIVCLAWLWTKSSEYEGDRRAAEWTSLVRTAHSVHEKAIPDSWATGVFVSTHSINGLLSAFKDTAISYDPKFKPDDTTLILKQMTVRSDGGFPSGEIDLIARSDKRDLEIELHGDAALIFEGIQIEPGATPRARFGVELLRLEPNLRWHFLSFSARGFAAELFKTGVAIALSKAMKFEMPLPDLMSLDLSQKRTDRVPVRDPKDQNWVDLVSTAPIGKLEQQISFGYPIFARDGMWLGAEERVGGQSPLEVVERGTRTDAELDKEIVQLRNELAQFKTPSSGNADFAIWINGKSLTALLQSVANLPSDRRTISVVSTAYAGYLAKKDWSDKILGNGGAFVEFNKPDAVQASASLVSFQTDWSANKGLHFTTHMLAAAVADVHVHVDPLIGGGVGTNVGMKGSAETDLNGEINFKVIKIGATSVLGFFPKLACETFNLDLATDGRLVGDWGWTKVPKLGGRFSAPVDSSMIAPQIILDSSPIAIGGRAKDGGGLQLTLGDGVYRVTPTWKMAEFSLIPLDAVTGGTGLMISSALKLELSAEWIDKSKTILDAEAKLHEAFKAGNKPDACAGDTRFAVLLGDIEIGPNNEIVKFLRNAWNDITKGPGKNNEIVKVLRAATDALTAAGQPLDDATKQALNDVDGLAKKTFGENSDAAKAVTAIASTVAPPTVGKNADGGVTVTVPGGGSVSTGGGHGGLGVTVQTPVGKWKF